MIGAKKAYDELVKNAIEKPTERQFPQGTPRGAGQKSTDWPYLLRPTPNLDTGPNGDLDLIN